MNSTAQTSIVSPMRTIKMMVLHCTASPNDRTLFTGTSGKPGFRTPDQEVDAWHCERGFMRASYWRGRQNSTLTSIGYHYLIARNGAVFTGRHEQEVGAHALGWNANSLGICLVGTDEFTPDQWTALDSVTRSLSARYAIPLQPAAVTVSGKSGVVRVPGVIGHGKLPGHNKTCPGFDVVDWLKTL